MLSSRTLPLPHRALRHVTHGYNGHSRRRNPFFRCSLSGGPRGDSSSTGEIRSAERLVQKGLGCIFLDDASSSPRRSPSSLGHCQPGHPHSWQPQQHLRHCSSHGHILGRSCRTQCSSLSRWGHHHSFLCRWGHHHSVCSRWGTTMLKSGPGQEGAVMLSTALPPVAANLANKIRSGQYVPMKELRGDNISLRSQLEALPTHQ